MKNNGILNLKPDWNITHKQLVNNLRQARVPKHYKGVYHEVVTLSKDTYSDNTDPVEKFRQRYGLEEEVKEVIIVPTTGYMVLRDWFPIRGQMAMFSPTTTEIIKGNCLISYDAGYEQASRERYMFDHFNDAHTQYRYNRRKTAKLAENHVKNYFLVQYSDFYRPASNEGDYKSPSPDDFNLVFPGSNGERQIVIDVKTWSDDENGRIRNIKDNIVYLFCQWLDDDTVRLDGIEWGKWLRGFGITEEQLTVVRGKHLLPVDILFVILNMARVGLDYVTFKNLLLEHHNKLKMMIPA